MAGVVRRVQPSDVDAMDKMILEEGWPTDLLRRRVVLSLPSSLWLVATSSQGDVIGQVGSVRPDSETVCYNGYVVQREWRGKEVGTLLWKSLAEDIPDSTTQWLCAIPGSRPMQIYQTVYNFELSYSSSTFSGKLVKTRLASLIHPANQEGAGEDGGTRVVPTDGLTDQLRLYDAGIRGKARSPEFFQQFVLGESKTASAAVLSASGDVIAYGVLHRYDKGGHVLGPLYADSEGVALTLLSFLLGTLSEGECIEINAVSTNHFIMNVVEQLGLKESMALAFMKRWGGPSGIQLGKVYANSSCDCFDYI